MKGDTDIATLLKACMRKMPSPVAIITTSDPQSGVAVGFAASAVMPVSMDPPSMLISINMSGSTHASIEAAGRFCINLLGIAHAHQISVFADPNLRDQRFKHQAWSTRSGLAYLAEGPSSIFCQTRAKLIHGTHQLFIGEVFDIHMTDKAEPLGWLDGASARLGRLDA